MLKLYFLVLVFPYKNIFIEIKMCMKKLCEDHGSIYLTTVLIQTFIYYKWYFYLDLYNIKLQFNHKYQNSIFLHRNIIYLYFKIA